MDKVDTSGDCWIWKAGIAKDGYGRFFYQGRNHCAHRISHILFNGPIADGLEVDHMCHTTRCVNPKHLRAVTHKQNKENLSRPHTNSRSGIRGVSWDSLNQLWRADLKHNWKTVYVGSFASIADAEAAVIEKRNELFTHNDLDRKAAT